MTEPASEISSERLLPPGVPDAWHFDFDLPCPVCRYNLRMLRRPRCPECGTTFRWQALLRIVCPRCGQSLHSHDGDACPTCRLALDWPRLLGETDPAKFKQFEYSRKPFRAALAAWRQALNPSRFWPTMPIELTPVRSRLRVLRRVGILAVLFAILSLVVLDIASGIRAVETWVVVATLTLAVPLLTMMLLPLFTPTLARFRVRSDQLARVLAYSTAGMVLTAGFLLAAVLVMGLSIFWWPWPSMGWMSRDLFIDFSTLVDSLVMGRRRAWYMTDQSYAFGIACAVVFVGLGVLWPWWFYTVALRRYLRLDRANVAALLLSTQSIVLLVMILILMHFGGLAFAAGHVLNRLGF